MLGGGFHGAHHVVATAAIALCLLAVAPAAVNAAGRLCVDAPGDTMCLSWVLDSTNITFTGRCRPPPGQHRVFWCAFGLSNVSTGMMFPSDVTVIQSTASGDSRPTSTLPAFFLEDRDSFVGYQSPPCYATQVSQLLNASLADGALQATWTRPLQLPPALRAEHHQDVLLAPQSMTVIAASSSDTGAALVACDPALQVHTYCVQGVAVQFA